MDILVVNLVLMMKFVWEELSIVGGLKERENVVSG